MDFFKKFLANVLPVNSIIKFMIKQFLSSYLIIKENDLQEKEDEESGRKNLIDINDLELNVSNINQQHLLHSPIKLLKGELGKFSLDITDENKLIITIEDVSLDFMPLFNYYKKYQKTLFNMETTKQNESNNNEKENKSQPSTTSTSTAQNQQPLSQNIYMLNMCNKLLTNLEINIKNISIKIFTYEINEKFIENPVFSLFIMNINMFKNENNEKKESITDPTTNLTYEETFLNNLNIEVDKLCLKVDQNLNSKDNKEFKVIKEICNNKKITKEQNEKITSFFISYNTIFAMNYKKGPCLSLKISTKPRIKKYKENGVEKEKVVEDMDLTIDIFEAESIITPKQLFDIQILSQISNFIFALNKIRANKEEENKKNENKIENKKEDDKEEEDKAEDNKEEDEKAEDSTSSSGVFNKNKIVEEDGMDEGEENNKIDFKINDNLIQNDDDKDNEKENDKDNDQNKDIKENKMEVLGREISKFNIRMNCKRIIMILLENNNNESIPKLFSFLMEDEIISKKKNMKNINNPDIDFEGSNESFENYYCYFEDNILFLKIEKISSLNTTIEISSIIFEYIKTNIISQNQLKKDSKEKTLLNKKNQNNMIEASIYESVTEYDDFKEVGSGEEDLFQSAIEDTQCLILENYHKFIDKFINGEYTYNKLEILIINEIKYNMSENILDIKDVLFNVNYIIILLYVKLANQVKYFIDYSQPIFNYEDIIQADDEIEENLNVNLEKKMNDSELQLMKNLSKGKTNKTNSGEDGNEEDKNKSLNESINMSEEEKNKNNGMKININFLSFKIYNVLKNIQRFDTNIYYYKLFLEMVYPNLSQKTTDNRAEPIEPQNLYELISKDFVEISLNNMNMNYYSISNSTKINIIFEEIALKYWNYVVIQYTSVNGKNNIDENPNIEISLPDMDIILDFTETIKINLEKNILDDLLSFNNTFLYGLSMYQIYDKYCSELYNNKLVNLFDLFGLKNHFQALNKLNVEEENKNPPEIVNKDKQELQEIKQKFLEEKPSIHLGGKINKCVINLNKNGTFEENEGNLIKIIILNIGLDLEMFSNNDKNKEDPFNLLKININNILFLIKEQPLSKDKKPTYYNIFSKNKAGKYESIDYFQMNFKFRNLKKTKDNVIIEEEEDDSSDEEKEIRKEKSKEKKGNENLDKKNSNKFEISQSKISLDKKVTDYIAFLLNNQVKLDNMEMVIDITLSEVVLDSFYHKLNELSTSLSDLYIDFSSAKVEETLDGTYTKPSDLIPLCEDRLMFFKYDFKIKNLTIDLFLREDKEKKKWMRLILLIEKFKFKCDENGIFLILENNYIYTYKNFEYIYYINSSKKKEEIFDIQDKISNIHKEDSYLKRLGYVEMFYNDKIELDKLEKELNVNLGNINLFFCKDSFDFVVDFMKIFSDNYLNKLKDIFSQDTLNSEDSNEDIENDDDINEIKQIEDKKLEVASEKKGKGFMDDFEEIDDVFFMDDMSKKKNDSKNKKNPTSKYLQKKDNDLSTIPEKTKSKGKNKNKTSNAFGDDFTIIETESSLQSKMLREKKEEDSEKYLLELSSLRIYLFSGSDFYFQDDPKKNLDLSSISQNDFILEDNDKEDQEEDTLEIDGNYLYKCNINNNNDKKNEKVFHVTKRKKEEERDYSNYILLNLFDLSIKIIDFSFYDLIIGNLYIDDNFEKSQYQHIISKQDYSNQISKFLICKIEMISNKKINVEKDVTCLNINLSIPSLDIFLDQLPLTFLLKIFLSINYDSNDNNEDNDSDKNMAAEKVNKNEDNKNSDKKNLKRINSKDSWNDDDEYEEMINSITFVNKISINPFNIKFNYHSHKLKFKKLVSDRDWQELLSLADVNDLNLKFKPFQKNIQTPLNDIISELFEYWRKDIMDNQLKDSVLRGFSITRPFFKLYDGVKDLVVQPYISYKKNEGIKRGIKKGMKNFFISFSSQGLFFGEKIFRGMKVVVFRKTKLSLKKKSLYKTWVYKINKKQHDYEAHYYKKK